MLQAIWFIFRLGLLSLAVAWVIEHPGTVVINIEPYEIKTSTAVLLFVIVFVVVIFALIYHFYRVFISVPSNMKKYREAKNKENGYLAITKGLAAIAAGDKNMANKHTNRAKKLLPNAALTSLLTAQASLLNGNIPIAEREFEALLDDNDASFFGVRGLINIAIKEQDNNKLISVMKRAEDLAPKQPWIAKQLFEFQSCNGEWKKAEQSLAKAVKLGAIGRKEATRHKQAILLAEAMEAEEKGVAHVALSLAKKAYKIDVSFVPAAVAYARLLRESNKRRSAVKVIEKTWSIYQHPELIDIWLCLLPRTNKNKSDKNGDTEEEYKWAYRLHKIIPFGKISNDMMGKVAMNAGKFDEAREFFKLSGNYKKLAKLEIKDGNNEKKAREWLEMASDTQEKPDWICEICGYKASKWQPICDNCSMFNSFEWMVPKAGYCGQLTMTSQIDSSIIEPPM